MYAMEEISDADLVKNYLAGDSLALEKLVSRHFKHVFLFAKTYVKQDQQAEDITQDVFVKVWKNLHKFDTDKKFTTWILQITKNTCIDLLRKNKNLLMAHQLEEETMTDSLEKMEDTKPLPDELYDSQDFEKKLDEVIGTLPPISAQVVRLHLQNDLTFQEISDTLDEPINTIKSRYRRALTSIQNRLA